MDTDTPTTSRPLWGWDELAAASGGRPDGAPTQAVAGIAIDSREISPGDVFFALQDRRDGHDFVSLAFAAGAAAAIVNEQYQRQDGDGALIRVSDTFAALEGVGRAARARLAPDARVIAVTGSAGKTTTKDMLRAGVASLGLTHAADRSFNNHLGVPLTLARMPADTRYGVFELGMNHAGEIANLTRLVRPHVAIVLNVLPAHLGNFAGEEEIADAKAEIFQGLEADGVAILSGDSRHFDRLREAAATHTSRIMTFGSAESGADAALIDCGRRARDGRPGQKILAELPSCGMMTYQIALAGRHAAENSLAALLAVDAVGGDVQRAAAALAEVAPSSGRGERISLPVDHGTVLLIDESYNANPGSMIAAIRTAAQARGDEGKRLILALGDMLELGERGQELHRGLADTINAVEADLVFTSGTQMAALFEALPEHRRGQWAARSVDLLETILATLQYGDVIMVKGSNGSAMGALVAGLKQHYSGPER